jgi:putative oxidoreductase
MSSTTDSLVGYTRSLLRIIVGFLFWFHGAQKLFGMFDGHRAMFPSLQYTAGVLEVVGGTLIFFGLFTRIAAFILSGEMACAYFMVHIHRAFWPIRNGGEPPVLFCFIFLYFAAAGGGLFSLDHAIWGKSAREGTSS